MIELRESIPRDIPAFIEMEKDADTSDFILPYSPERHQSEFAKPDIVYLSILNAGELAGFFILVLEADGRSVEFRRIVVADKGKGLAQAAIPAMEEYCRERLGRNRIWLDVFEFNQRGQHIYQKLGYRRFDQGEAEGKVLFFYDKLLNN
jgi:RimJ/RimL family protein N-acetyltransferase